MELALLVVDPDRAVMPRQRDDVRPCHARQVRHGDIPPKAGRGVRIHPVRRIDYAGAEDEIARFGGCQAAVAAVQPDAPLLPRGKLYRTIGRRAKAFSENA